MDSLAHSLTRTTIRFHDGGPRCSGNSTIEVFMMGDNKLTASGAAQFVETLRSKATKGNFRCVCRRNACACTLCELTCKNVCHASVVIQLFTILFLVAVGLWTVCSFTFTATILHAEVLIPSIYFIANILMVTFLPITVTSVRLV